MSEAIIDINSKEHLENGQKEPIPKTDFVVRVLNGKQQGAEISLVAARYRLGSADDNDIVLLGENVSPHHCELFFANGLTSLTKMQNDVSSGNKLITRADLPLEIAAGEVIVIGTIAISITNAQSDWLSADEISSEIATSIEKFAASQPSAFWQTLWQQLKNRNLIAQAAFGASLAVSFFIIALAFSLHGTRNAKSIANSAADRLVEQLASDPAYNNIFLINAEPKKQLIGWVGRNADLNRLLNLASTSLVDINIVSLEKVDKSLNIISEVYGGNLSYKLTPGKNRDIHLLLYGTIEASTQREVVRSLLRRDLPAITSIEIDIITESESLDIINSWLERYPNFIGIKAEKTNRGIFIKGNLLGNFRKDWEEALVKSPPHLPQNMLPFIDVYFSPIFPGKIISLITGEKPQVRIFYKNNSTVAVLGDKVQGGFLISEIKRDKIILSWRNKKFIYQLPN